MSCQRGGAIAAEPSRWLRLPGLLYTVAFGRCENLKAFDPACVAARLVASVGRWAVQVKDGSQNGRHRTNDTFVRKPVRYSSSMCLSCAAPFIEPCTIFAVVCGGGVGLGCCAQRRATHVAPNGTAGWHSGTQQSQWEEPTGKPVAAAAEAAADNDNADKVRTTPEDTVKTDKESAAMVAEKTGTLEDNVADEDGTTAMVTEQAGTPEEMVKEVAETTAMVTDYTGSVATLTQAGGGMADAPQVAVAGTL
eukprot:COSAG02_NODE_15056_length_1209_cov_1.057658_1_plen_249_part_10